jgi:putative tryptophan/tyrosine transport system substrate-binding protein
VVLACNTFDGSAHCGSLTPSLFSWTNIRIIALAIRHAVPVVSQFRAFAIDGGLASYGTSLTDANRLLGVYVGRVLKGKKPADLPVIQSTKFDLTINLKSAKALGLSVPDKLLTTADEVIE